MFKHLRPVVAVNSSKLIIGILALIAVDLLALISPWVLGLIIDGIGSHNLSNSDLNQFILILLAVEVLVLSLRYVCRTMMNKAAYDIEFRLRTLYFSHLLKMDSEFFMEQKTGDLMARATNDIQAVTNLFVEGILMFVDSILIIIVVLWISITSISAELTFVSIINLPILAAAIIIGSPLVGKRYKKMNETFGKLSEKVREFISGIRLLKAFNKESLMIKIFKMESLKLYRDGVKFSQVIVALNPLIRVIAFISTIIAVFYGGILVLDGALSIGKFSSFVAYLQRLVWPFMAVGFLISVLQMGMASISRLNEIFDTLPGISDKSADPDIKTLSGHIRIENLSFQYPGTFIPALKHVSVNIPEGSSLGIIGKTGSGKTTLANLLIRRYDTNTDSIFYGSDPIRKIPVDTLLDNIGYAFQDAQVFSLTIRENLTIHNKDLNSNELRYYADIACVDREIQKMPDGYDSLLGENGINLSGGQKQRISIARALCHKPKIVILDDALSAVDNKTQVRLLLNLKKELKGKTSIIISHRISTVMNCDNIIVMDDGFVIQQGRHDELINKPGLYRDLFTIQNSTEDGEGGEIVG